MRKYQYEDLTVYPRIGYAHQTELTASCDYDQEYFAKYVNYGNTMKGVLLNQYRTDFVKAYLDDEYVLDIGVGSGSFMNSHGRAYGFDINPVAIELIKQQSKWIDPYTDSLTELGGFCLWDCLEHLENPSKLISLLPWGSYCFVSIPIFENLFRIKQSRHYRPGEHLHYWTIDGLILWFQAHDFTCLQVSDFESRLGREDIFSFAFVKD